MAKVILLHGLYMGGWIMEPLAKKLRKHGWQPLCIGYNSVNIQQDKLFTKIDEHMSSLAPSYLVGHSLGGVLLGQYVHQRNLALGSAVVTLGSPLNGAAIARTLDGWGLGKMLGNAKEHGLVSNALLQWESPTPLGSIAGNRSFGMGMLTGATTNASDGTVEISETQITGMHDHICVDATHTSMLFNNEVARQTDAFLRQLQFARI